ncbi:hypothetical protein Nepgr_000981 [Nepenthes gracilis]|uniref:Uncharacterized protein n=1 Tax=Nepenthes gracilis TaxID=150966 RepID=A0AAD3P4J7_NEPGR|nr:hypothetical protein Nepgr_000981 [Nepenthes gracilis]
MVEEQTDRVQPIRGRTRCVKWKSKRDDNPAPVKIDLPSSLRRIVGENAQQFITEISYLVKQYCPINVDNWKQMDAHIKMKLMQKVKEKYVLPNENHVNMAIQKELMKRFRTWRFGLRRDYYKKYRTDKERIENCPPNVDIEQWKWLVLEYWGSQKFRHMSENNSKNRSKQRMMSCVGTKSIARTLHEMVIAIFNI